MSECKRCKGNRYIPDPAPDPYDFGGNISCPDCNQPLQVSVIGQAATTHGLTINGMVEMAYGTAKANGWHDRQGETLDADHAAAQLAFLARIITAVAKVAEAIRKPTELDTGEAVFKLRHEVEQLCRNDIRGEADSYLDYPMGEVGKFVDGSKTQVQSWLVLMVTELAEAMEAVEKGDQIKAGNLCRHTAGVQDIATGKADAVAARLNLAHPHANVTAVSRVLSASNVGGLSEFDLMIDCTGSDNVLRILREFSWNSPRMYLSVSMGLNCRRLFVFHAQGEYFPQEDFLELVQPWLATEVKEFADKALPREGVGCWHPVFPGRVDDIWLMAATAAKAVEQALTGPPGNPVLYVYEQQETDGAFGGVRMVSRQVKP